MTYILDACAMIAYLRGEAGADVVSAILIDSMHEPLAHALNLCEVYYDFYRASGADVADGAVQDLMRVGVRIRSDISPEFWKAAGALKASLRRISLADCFAVTGTSDRWPHPCLRPQ